MHADTSDIRRTVVTSRKIDMSTLPPSPNDHLAQEPHLSLAELVTRFVTRTLCHVVRPVESSETRAAPMRWSGGDIGGMGGTVSQDGTEPNATCTG
jgi:hypothetical protein